MIYLKIILFYLFPFVTQYDDEKFSEIPYLMDLDDLPELPVQIPSTKKLPPSEVSQIGKHWPYHITRSGVPFAIQLINGSVEMEGNDYVIGGRVEIRIYGRLGVICDDGWTHENAAVVCKELGFTFDTAIAVWDGRYGNGNKLFHMGNVQCTGTESSISECPFLSSSMINCGQTNNAVGIQCRTSKMKIPLNVTLTNTTVYQEGKQIIIGGRLQLYSNGQLGSVCDKSWDILDANVACNNLNFPLGAVEEIKSLYYEGIKGEFCIEDVKCNGNEKTLSSCDFIKQNNCNDYSSKQSAGVKCWIKKLKEDDFQLRLQNSSVFTENDKLLIGGRAEMKKGGIWKTICNSNSWTDIASSLFCREMGFSSGAFATVRDTFYGNGEQQSEPENIECTGHEKSVELCRQQTKWGYQTKCSSNNAVGIKCVVDDIEPSFIFLIHNSTITYENAKTEISGLLQGKMSDTTKYLCKIEWTESDADEICKQIGFNLGGNIVENIEYLAIEESVFDISTCEIKEKRSIHKCLDEIPKRKCDGELTGIKCLISQNDERILFKSAIVDGQFMSSEDIITVGGKVEIRMNNEAGTICNEAWTENEAKVLCRELGFELGQLHLSLSGNFSQENHFIRDIYCTGFENRLAECNYNHDMEHECQIETAPKVFCMTKKEKTQKALRLKDTTIKEEGNMYSISGNVEMLDSGYWKDVCFDSSDDKDAAAICQILGYNFSKAFVFKQMTEKEEEDYNIEPLIKLKCPTDVRYLSQCNSVYPCSKTEQMRVSCLIKRNVDYTDFKIRISQAKVLYQRKMFVVEGRLEVNLFGYWGSICDEHWEKEEAEIVCSELGFNGRIQHETTIHGRHGKGNGIFLMKDVLCHKNETSLKQCHYTRGPKGIGCKPHEARGVVCELGPQQSDVPFALRFSEDVTISHEDDEIYVTGQIEIRIDKKWGIICADEKWDYLDADVACKHLGYFLGAKEYTTDSERSSTIRPSFVIKNTECRNDHNRFDHCHFEKVERGLCKLFAGIVCRIKATSEDIRLIEPNKQIPSPYKELEIDGHLEIKVEGKWGVICDDKWDILEADVACRQLGFHLGAAKAVRKFNVKKNTDFAMYEVNCQGNEKSLQQCHFLTSSEYQYCRQGEAAGVTCRAEKESSVFSSLPYIQLANVSLTDGKDSVFIGGRVEIYAHHKWGVICDDHWGLDDANVVCKQLGFPKGANSYRNKSYFGAGNNFFQMDDVKCQGNEKMVSFCPSIKSHHCEDDEAAGVICDAGIENFNGLFKIRIKSADVEFSENQLMINGYLEARINGNWALICDYRWAVENYQVACIEMGFKHGRPTFVRQNSLDAQTQISTLKNVDCNGNEKTLLECDHEIDEFWPRFVDIAYAIQLECWKEKDSSLLPFDVRLTNVKLKETEHYHLVGGVVEVHFKGQWGHICNDGWNINEADVACKHIGFTDGADNAGNEFGRPDITNFIMDNFVCNQQDHSLNNCQYKEENNCAVLQAAGIWCKKIKKVYDLPLNFRLVNANVEDRDEIVIVGGLLEVRRKGDWSAISADIWNSGFSETACQEMEFKAAKQFNKKYCLQCNYLKVRNGCLNGKITQPDCYEVSNPEDKVAIELFCVTEKKGDNLPFSMRLYSGSISQINNEISISGWILIRLHGIWGFICDQDWKPEDANGLCSELGFLRADNSNEAKIKSEALIYSMRNSRQCSRNWFSMEECKIKSDEQKCTAEQAISVSCIMEKSIVSISPIVRLVNAVVFSDNQDNLVEGQLQIKLNQWNNISPQQWHLEKAIMACRDLGFQLTAKSEISFDVDEFSNFNNLDVQSVFCNGSELVLSNCQFTPSEEEIKSIPGTICRIGKKSWSEPYEIQMVKGITNVHNNDLYITGEIEIKILGKWVKLSWQERNSNSDLIGQVICREFGFWSGALEDLSKVSLGKAIILINHIHCNGNEGSLAECYFGNNNIWQNYCGKSKSAIVKCKVSNTDAGVEKDITERLWNTTVHMDETGYIMKGLLLQMKSTRSINFYCKPNWDIDKAHSTCHQMGFNLGSKSFTYVPLTDHFIDTYNNTCYDPRMMTCLKDMVIEEECILNKILELTCIINFQVSDFPFSLQLSNATFQQNGSVQSLEGRVEVRIDGNWGVVCDDFWDLNVANLVCNSLSFTSAAKFVGKSYYGFGNGNILMDNVQCTGIEHSLKDCHFLDRFHHNCKSSEIAGVQCITLKSDIFSNAELRLTTGTIKRQDDLIIIEGIVEIKNNQVWSLMCDQQWNIEMAKAICEKLGFILHPKEITELQNGFKNTLKCKRKLSCLYRPKELISTSIVRIDDSSIYHKDSTIIIHGRAEIFFDYSWKPICYDDWNQLHASSFCNGLGFLIDEWAEPLVFNETLSNLLTPISSSDGCKSIHNCVVGRKCNSGKLVGVNCKLPNIGSKNNFELKIGQANMKAVHDDIIIKGILHVKIGDHELPVCSDGWTSEMSTVACKEMGFLLGQNIEWLQEEKQETEFSFCVEEIDHFGLLNCHFNKTKNCQYKQQVGILCKSSKTKASPDVLFSVNIINATYKVNNYAYIINGEIEIVMKNKKGGICHKYFSKETRAVACRELGFEEEAEPFHINYGESIQKSIIFTEVKCNGYENALHKCDKFIDYQHNDCENYSKANIACRINKEVVYEPFDIRLANASIKSEHSKHMVKGRLEIRLFGKWGVLCHNNWIKQNTKVVCKELGLLEGQIDQQINDMGDKDSWLWRKDFECTGKEYSLLDCFSEIRSEKNCSAIDIICHAESFPTHLFPFTLQLNNVTMQRRHDHSYIISGRVEVIIMGVIGDICDDEWDLQDADVVCRQLGFEGGALSALGHSHFGTGNGNFLMDNVKCKGMERSLEYCEYSTNHNCYNNEVAAVICQSHRKDLHSTCGWRSTDDQRYPISNIQGSPAYGSHPWLAMITTTATSIICSGVIIDEFHIIAAVSCLKKFITDPDIVIIGKYNNKQHIYEQRFEVDEIKLSSKRGISDINIWKEDIALVRLKSKFGDGIQFNRFIQPICLPERDNYYPPEGHQCEITGWNIIDNTIYNVLTTKISILPTVLCNNFGLRNFICVANINKWINCKEDNGDPLICKINGKYTLMGISNPLDKCYIQDKPNLFISISKHLRWIQQSLHEN